MTTTHLNKPQRIFGAELRAARQSAGISLRKLARTIGISAPFLSDVELGRRMPSREKIKLITTALGLAPTDLLKFDPRESLGEIFLTVESVPNSLPALTDLCRGMTSGKITVEEVRGLAGKRC